MLAAIFQEGGRVISGLLQTYGIRRSNVALAEPGYKEPEQGSGRVTTDETIQYQKKQIVKELTLLEGHLQEGCKINRKACDCCEKHPTKIEGLAQETAGMTPEPVFKELAEWAQEIAPITTEAAVASGKYDDEYPKLAIKARELRKAIMPIGNREVSKKEVEDGETVPEEGK